MTQLQDISPRVLISIGCALALAIAHAANAAGKQEQPEVPASAPSSGVPQQDFKAKVEDAFNRVSRGDLGTGIEDATAYIEVAAHADPQRVIPVLEALFDKSTEQEFRVESASVLDSIGDQNPRYFDLLVEQANIALKNDGPDPFGATDLSDPTGMCDSPDFLAWAKAYDRTPEAACKVATIDAPFGLRSLAETGDPRAIPILQDALRAQNFMIRIIAARGLIMTHDRDSMTLIIDMIQTTSNFEAQRLADCLAESDDPRVGALWHKYSPETTFADARKFRAELTQWRRPILIRK